MHMASSCPPQFPKSKTLHLNIVHFVSWEFHAVELSEAKFKKLEKRWEDMLSLFSPSPYQSSTALQDRNNIQASSISHLNKTLEKRTVGTAWILMSFSRNGREDYGQLFRSMVKYGIHFIKESNLPLLLVEKRCAPSGKWSTWQRIQCDRFPLQY